MTSWLPNPFRVVILGGGISGFSAAQTILKYAQVPCEITVLEKQSRVGGWLESSRLDDGTILEHGPRSARSTGTVALRALSILSELGIEDKIIGIPKSSDVAKRRFIYANGEMHTLPSSIKTVITKQQPFSQSLLKVLLKEIFVKKSSNLDEDESVYDFFNRRFGNEIAEYMSDPLCRGIFGGDARQLSLKTCFPILHEYERQHGSVVRGMMFSRKEKQDFSSSTLVQKAKSEKWVSWSMENGLETLPDLWHNFLTEKGAAIKLNTPCNRMDVTPDLKILCRTPNETFVADRVISSLPGVNLSPLIEGYSTELSQLISEIKYANMAVVSLQFENSDIPYSGFGFLVPSSEPVKVLGMTFDSLLFPPFAQNTSIVTVMAGGAWFDKYFGSVENADVSSITELALKSARDILKIREKPKRVVCKIQKNCIPQYHVGHDARCENIKRKITGDPFLPLTIVGSLYGGVGINDCIVNARNETLKWMTSNHLY